MSTAHSDRGVVRTRLARPGPARVEGIRGRTSNCRSLEAARHRGSPRHLRVGAFEHGHADFGRPPGNRASNPRMQIRAEHPAARGACGRPGPAGPGRRTGPATCARCPRALPPQRRSARWTYPEPPGARSAPAAWPGTRSYGPRPPSSTGAARRRSGLSGARQQQARQASRSEEVDQDGRSLPHPLPPGSGLCWGSGPGRSQ